MFVEHTGSEDEDLLSVYYDDAELRLDIHFVLYAGCILLITTLFLLHMRYHFIIMFILILFGRYCISI